MTKERPVTIREVYELLEHSRDDLEQQIKEGFKGVHDRQDQTNGNVIKNTEFRQKATGTIETIKWLLGFVGIGTIITLIRLFFQ